MTAMLVGAVKRGAVVSIDDVTTTNTRVDPADALAFYELESGGDVNTSTATTGGTTDVGDWITPKAAAGDAYEARVTVNSGSLTSGTEDTWLALGTTRRWERSRTTIGSDNVNFTVEIRRASTGQVLDSATIDLTATVTT